MSPLKKFLSVLLTLLFIWVTPANSNANTVFSLAGDVTDWGGGGTTWYANEVTAITLVAEAPNPDLVTVEIKFKYGIGPEFLAGGNSNQLVRLKLYKSEPDDFVRDTFGHIWVDAPNVVYATNTLYDAESSVYAGEGMFATSSRQVVSCGSKAYLTTKTQPTKLAITFSRLCLGLPSVFWVGVQFDTNKTSNLSTEQRHYPKKAFKVDMTSVVALKHEQTFSFTPQGDISVAKGSVPLAWSATTASYGPGTLEITSLTPNVCSYSSATPNTLRLLSSGECSIRGTISETRSSKASTPATLKFQVLPKPSPTITVAQLQPTYLEVGSASLNVTNSGNGSLSYSTGNTAICSFRNSAIPTITFNSPGLCTVLISARETETFAPVNNVLSQFQILPNRINQSISPSGVLRSVKLSEGAVNLNFTSPSGNPISITPLGAETTQTCRLSSTNPVKIDLINVGTCTFQLKVEGNVAYYGTTREVSFDVLQRAHSLVGVETVPKRVNYKSKSVRLNLRSSAGFEVRLVDDGGKACNTSGDWGDLQVKLTWKGECNLKVDARQTPDYEPVETEISFKVDPHITTITCKAGELSSRKVTGFLPKCPAGYKRIG